MAKSPANFPETAKEIAQDYIWILNRLLEWRKASREQHRALNPKELLRGPMGAAAAVPHSQPLSPQALNMRQGFEKATRQTYDPLRNSKLEKPSPQGPAGKEPGDDDQPDQSKQFRKR